MTATSHKYHNWLPSYERQYLDIYHPVRNELEMPTNLNYAVDSTVVANEAYKTSSGISYKGLQKPNYEAIYKKAPGHWKVNYVDDSETSKVKYPKSLPDKTKLYRSSTHQSFRNPHTDVSFPTFTNIIPSKKTINEYQPFTGISISKSDYGRKLKSDGSNEIKPDKLPRCKSHTFDAPITKWTHQPKRRLLPLKPDRYKISNLSGHNTKLMPFTTSTNQAHDWKLKPANELFPNAPLRIQSYYGNNNWGEPNRFQTSYSCHGQDPYTGKGLSMPSAYN